MYYTVHCKSASIRTCVKVDHDLTIDSSFHFFNTVALKGWPDGPPSLKCFAILNPRSLHSSAPPSDSVKTHVCFSSFLWVNIDVCWGFILVSPLHVNIPSGWSLHYMTSTLNFTKMTLKFTSFTRSLPWDLGSYFPLPIKHVDLNMQQSSHTQYVENHILKPSPPPDVIIGINSISSTWRPKLKLLVRLSLFSLPTSLFSGSSHFLAEHVKITVSWPNLPFQAAPASNLIQFSTLAYFLLTYWFIYTDLPCVASFHFHALSALSYETCLGWQPSCMPSLFSSMDLATSSWILPHDMLPPLCVTLCVTHLSSSPRLEERTGRN